MQTFIPPTYRPEHSSGSGKNWSSNQDWWPAKSPSTLKVDWSTMYDLYDTPVATVFLGQLRSLEELKASPRWIVRDGLIPLLDFFVKVPAPEKKFRARLFVPAKWREFIPLAWRPFCASYSLRFLPEEEIWEKPQTIRERRRWITAMHLSPGFCSLRNLEQTLANLRADPALSDLRRRAPVDSYVNIGCVAPEYLFPFQRALHETLRGDISFLDHFSFKHFSDLRDAVVLDLNEQLLCADDAHLHLMLARGAILPGTLPGAEDPAFVRLSPFHGYALAELAPDLKYFFDEFLFVEWSRYLESIPPGNDPLFVDLPCGKVHGWIWRFAQSRICERL